MSKLGNELTMLELLANGKKYSISELANILEVSERMVRIYKDDAEKAGIYIDTIYGPYGGYVLNQSIHLPKRRFNKSDYEFLNSLEVKKEDKEKLKIITDKVRGVYFGSKLEKTEIEKDCKNYYNIFSRAIKEKRKVKIKYYSYTKGETERIIHPLDMFLYQTGWGIAAFCELRNDLRHFELKRISYIELLDEKF